MGLIVAIDGPAGSGKSSVAKTVAKELGFFYVDTGAIYRAIALQAQKQRVAETDADAVAEIANRLQFEFRVVDGEQRVFLDNKDVSEAIRTEAISQGSSVVSQYPNVRQAIFELQRRLGKDAEIGAVLEGRDIGTVIFPDADVKFFLTASAEKRAKRRQLQLGDAQSSQYETILQEIKKRDKRDQTRAVAPLVPAQDAIVIDTTELTESEVVQLIKQKVKKR